MLNLVRIRALAGYPDGRATTGAGVYAAYGRESNTVFRRVGGPFATENAGAAVSGTCTRTGPEKSGTAVLSQARNLM